MLQQFYVKINNFFFMGYPLIDFNRDIYIYIYIHYKGWDEITYPNK